MIKIIKNSLTEPITVTCQNCASIFSYTFDDIKRDEISSIFDICGSKTVKRYVICPVCKSDIVLDAIKNNNANNTNVVLFSSDKEEGNK